MCYFLAHTLMYLLGVLVVLGIRCVLAADSLINDPIPSQVSSYLTTFGYLPPNDPNTGNLRSESAVRHAIRRLQRFAGLKPTGTLNEETKRLLATKRCGVPDFQFEDASTDLRYGRARHKGRRRKRYILQGSKWDHLNLTFHIQNFTPELGRGRVRRIVHDSLNLWSQSSALEFREVRSENADIVIKFVHREHGDGYPFDGPNVVLAHAFFPGVGMGGDAHFDEDEIWADKPVSIYGEEVNLHSVAAHEFGHSLGLAHSNVQGSLMYPYYRHTMQHKTLPYDDVIGIQKIYGSGGNPVPKKPTNETETTDWWNNGLQPSSTIAPTTSTRIRTTTTGPPKPCDTHLNAISRIRNEIFVFKGRYFWRFDPKGYLVDDPIEIFRFWHGFPSVFSGGVDAIFERIDSRGRDEIFFFVGNHYWVFQANRAKPGYPQPLSGLGLPAHLQRVDAAFVWDYNQKAYLFAGDQYWRFDDASRKVVQGYPNPMSVWKGVPHDLDAAFTDHEKNSYFLKNDLLYKFDSYFMRVSKGYPVNISSFWNHCSDNSPIRFAFQRSAGALSSPFRGLCFLCLCVVLVVVMLVIA